MCFLQMNLDFVFMETMLGFEFGVVDDNVLHKITLIQLERLVEDPLWYGVEYQ